MVQSRPDRARATFASGAMRKPLASMRREIAGVRRDKDIECVHRMRVASRRLRNALCLFGSEIPPAVRDRWQKRLRGVTRCLGAARDLDVQIAFLRQWLHELNASCTTDRAGIEHVLATLTSRRGELQAEVLTALDRLESSGTLAGLSRWVKEQPAAAEMTAAHLEGLRAEASRAVRHRLGDLLAFERFVERPEAAEELHAMRIAAKHLRYTLEVYAPLYAGGLSTQIQWGRQLQDWLGEIHDCDVWQLELGRLVGQLAAAPSPGPGQGTPASSRLVPGLEHLRRDRAERRAEVYGIFASAWRKVRAADYWKEFRRPFVVDRAADVESTAAGRPGDGNEMNSKPKGCGRCTALEPPDDARLQPAVALAQSCRYEVEHTQQVTRVALRLFDRLPKLHGLDEERRFWLTCASLLHDIGWIEGRAAHHKTALRIILESPLLPWDQRLRRIVGLVARYHRKALPSDDHEHFEALSAADRLDVRKLAAILRIADALDYSHACLVDDVACRVTARRIGIRCAVTRPADVECARAVEKGDLATQVFDREISVTWHLR